MFVFKYEGGAQVVTLWLEMMSEAHYDDHSIFIPFFFSLYVSILIAVMRIQFQVDFTTCYLQSTRGKSPTVNVFYARLDLVCK